MKKLLLCSLVVVSGIAYSKEVMVTPQVLVEPEIMEKTEPMVMLESTVSDTIEMKENSLNNIYLRVGLSPLARYSEFSAKDKTDKRITDGNLAL